MGAFLDTLRCTSIRQWQEEVVRPLTLDFEPFNEVPFSASFKLPLNQPTVIECQFSAGTIIRRLEAIKSMSDTFSFIIAKTSGVCCEQNGYDRRSNRGEAGLMRNDSPMRMGSTTGFRGTDVLIPRTELEARGIRPDDVVMRCLSPQNEALGLLRSYLQVLGKSGVGSGAEFGTAKAVREIVQRHIFDFVALAVSWQGAVGESNLESVVDARLRAALSYIETHFDNPRLTLEMVAHSQGISAAYLRRLMKASGRSYLKIVNELRLQKAFKALSEVGRNDRTIFEIAMTAGFSDIAHFHRLFRARFDDTPGAVRKKSCSLG